MKRIIAYITIFFVFASIAEAKLNIGFIGGFSTPNDKINDVFNISQLEIKDKGISNILRESVAIGYHLGIRGRLPLTDDLNFIGGMEYHRFPQNELNFSDPADPTDADYSTFLTRQNVLTFLAGFDYYVINTFADFYLTADLEYNYLSSVLDFYDGEKVVLPTLSPSDNRAGIGFGAGMDINVDLVKLNLECKYNIANLVGKKNEELDKGYFCVTIGIFFGE